MNLISNPVILQWATPRYVQYQILHVIYHVYHCVFVFNFGNTKTCYFESLTRPWPIPNHVIFFHKMQYICVINLVFCSTSASKYSFFYRSTQFLTKWHYHSSEINPVKAFKWENIVILASFRWFVFYYNGIKVKLFIQNFQKR